MHGRSRLARRSAKCALTFLAATGLALMAASVTVANEYKTGDLTLKQVWSRATPGGAKVGAGYLTIHNGGTQADRLVRANAAISGHMEIHEMNMDGGIMRMRPLKDGLLIPPGETVSLKPGGYHLMFMNLKSPIKQGRPFKATLEFEKAGKMEVSFEVAPIGAAKPAGSHSGSHTDPGKSKSE